MHPLGLILRGGRNYLAATRGGKEPLLLYAMHRFMSVDVTLKQIGVDGSITLDAALSSGQAQFGAAALLGKPIGLLIACTPEMSRLLQEAPLGLDQTSQPMDDGRTQFSVQLPDSWELRWWLISRGTDVEVLKPTKLRMEVRDALQTALNQYSLMD